MKRFQEFEFRPGDIVKHEWLFEQFGITMPKPDEKLTRREFDAINLRFLKQFEEFRVHLLEELQVDLEAKPGIGYIVIQPHEQAEKALDSGMREVGKAVRKMNRRVINVDYNQLTQEQRQQHAESLKKLGVFMGMIGRERRKLMLPVRRADAE